MAVTLFDGGVVVVGGVVVGGTVVVVVVGGVVVGGVVVGGVVGVGGGGTVCAAAAGRAVVGCGGDVVGAAVVDDCLGGVVVSGAASVVALSGESDRSGSLSSSESVESSRLSDEKGELSLFSDGEPSEVELSDPLPQLAASRARGISRPRVR